MLVLVEAEVLLVDMLVEDVDVVVLSVVLVEVDWDVLIEVDWLVLDVLVLRDVELLVELVLVL